jgi:hypothetical protein
LTFAAQPVAPAIISKESIAIASNATALKSAVRRRRESLCRPKLARPNLRRSNLRRSRRGFSLKKIALEIEIEMPFMTCQLPV